MSAVKEKWRLSDEMLHGRQPARKKGKPRGPRPRPFRQGMLLGICIGMTAALLIGVTGFLLTRPRAEAPAAESAAADTKAGTKAGTTTGTEPGTQAAISITAEHLGDLQLRIEARVSAPGSYDPITKGQVVAYTDMVAMPMAHKQGPIVMAEISGKPGVYEAATNVPMAGEYNVIVEVKQPMASTANQRLEVGTVTPK
ncbi:FixH family protein [Actinoplanes sp. NPDC023936]|uniref:FixH family protein n=1 Tax=Actinoplanes sp. NPDC023936 TaxID=3154910 RepID=UPI003409985A